MSTISLLGKNSRPAIRLLAGNAPADAVLLRQTPGFTPPGRANAPTC